MNRIMLIGNLTFDPELRVTPTGTSVCTFNIAVNRRFASQNGERQTDFFRIVAWRQLGENCAKYLTKGKKVFVSGELQVRTYEDKNGVQRTTVEVAADEIEFLSPRAQDNGATPYQTPNYQTSNYQTPNYQSQPNQSSNASAITQPPVVEMPDEFKDLDDDELPF